MPFTRTFKCDLQMECSIKEQTHGLQSSQVLWKSLIAAISSLFEQSERLRVTGPPGVKQPQPGDCTRAGMLRRLRRKDNQKQSHSRKRKVESRPRDQASTNKWVVLPPYFPSWLMICSAFFLALRGRCRCRCYCCC